MRLLILGYSSIVERRVMPAAAKVGAIEEISIASKSRPQPERWPKQGRFFNDYETALRDSDSRYRLSFAAECAARALGDGGAGRRQARRGRQAGDDDIGGQRARRGEARRADRLVAEATVFGYHPQFEALAAFVAETGPLTQVAAQFIIPPLPIGNFRNHAELGGGCLLDMGPYAAATMRILGGGGGIGNNGAGRRPASRNRRRHGFLGPGPARQWRRVFRPFQLRGRVSESLARCGPFGVRANRACLHSTRRSSDGMAPARTQCR